ncbi:MAG: methyl-accepting chemotaxis protein [Desulfobacteraceae bacterium]|nr:MAG: methyl-accepting chemotaxis protein [Desulfobacteraceae bacterium]
MSFKNRILLVVSFLILIVSLILIYAGNAGRDRVEKSLAKPVNVGKLYAWEMAVEEFLVRMNQRASDMADDYEIKTALKDKDMTRVKHHADKFYDLMKEQKVFTNLLLTDAKGELVYSSPAPASGKSVQTTVAKALEIQKEVVGLEKDNNGSIVLSLAIPIKSRRKLYGTGVYNLGMKDLCQAVSERDGSHIFLVSDEGRLSAGSNPELFSALNLTLPALEKVDLFTQKGEDAAYSIAVQPVLDMNDMPVARLVSVTDITERFTQSRNADLVLIVAMAGAILLALFSLRIYVIKAFRPLEIAINMISQVAAGNLTQKLDADQPGEIGTLSSSLNDMRKNLQQMILEITTITKRLTSSAGNLSDVAGQINTNSEQNAERAANVASAAQQMSGNMDRVAVETEQTNHNIQEIVQATQGMADAITDIARSIATGSQTTTRAVDQATEVSIKVDELGTTAGEISRVTESIADISDQTNLLALNATIEAARAGEAGKGFAVVANEIKDLARQTAEATMEINKQISRVQTTTRESVQAIEAIVQVIHDINEMVTSVSAAVEEQSATVKEISTNVNQAAETVDQIHGDVEGTALSAADVKEDIKGLSQTASDNVRSSNQVNISADELVELAGTLNQMVNRFEL